MHWVRFRQIAVMGVLLAACSGMRWERPDTDAATVDEDLQRCELLARSHARRSRGIADQPAVIVSPHGGAGVAVPPSVVGATDPAAEYDALSACMRDKGYRQRTVP